MTTDKPPRPQTQDQDPPGSTASVSAAPPKETPEKGGVGGGDDDDDVRPCPADDPVSTRKRKSPGDPHGVCDVTPSSSSVAPTAKDPTHQNAPRDPACGDEDAPVEKSEISAEAHDPGTAPDAPDPARPDDDPAQPNDNGDDDDDDDARGPETKRAKADVSPSAAEPPSRETAPSAEQNL